MSSTLVSRNDLISRRESGLLLKTEIDPGWRPEVDLRFVYAVWASNHFEQEMTVVVVVLQERVCVEKDNI